MKKYFILELEKRIKALREAALQKEFKTNISLNWCISNNLTILMEEADKLRKHLRESLDDYLVERITKIEETAQKPFGEIPPIEWKEILGDDAKEFEEKYVEFLKEQDKFLNEDLEKEVELYKIEESKIASLDIPYGYFEMLIAFIKTE